VGTFDNANAGVRTATAAYTLANGTGLATNYSLGDTTHSATITSTAITPVTTVPAIALVLPLVGPSLGPPRDGAISNAVVVSPGASSAGVTVNTVNSSTQIASGLISVLVPQATAIVSTSLVIALPEAVIAPAQSTSLQVTVTLANDQPLPSWIRYDPELKALVTNAAPNEAFPLTVVLTVGSQRTVIQVSESQEK
jgi:hypothetical protein